MNSQLFPLSWVWKRKKKNTYLSYGTNELELSSHMWPYAKRKRRMSNIIQLNFEFRLAMSHIRRYLPMIAYCLLIGFVIWALLYDHVQRGYLLTKNAKNASDYIERALQRIPVCTEADRSRQRALLYTLQAWTNLVRTYRLPYWISHQTLASYIQYRALAPYDLRIDLSMMADHTSQLIQLMKINPSSIYELQISNRSSSLSRSIDQIQHDVRFLNREKNVSINIWSTDKVLRSNSETVLNRNVPLIDWIYPLELCVLSGIRVWCPAQAKKLVTLIYRNTNTAVFCINQTWIRR